MRAIRKLTPIDQEAYAAHLLRLSEEDRRLRFMGRIDEAGVRAHVRGLNWSKCIVVGWFEQGALRAAAELQLDRALCPHHGEIAVTVDPDWQGHGVGKEIVRRAVQAARNRGAEALHMSCLPHNRKMQAIARRLGWDVSFDSDESAAKLALTGPTPASLWFEYLEDSQGVIDGVACKLLAA